MPKAKAKQAKKAKTVKAIKPVKTAKPAVPTVVVLHKGVEVDGRRGLMGKMVAVVSKAKRGLSRDELAKRFNREPRVKVSKNVQWGIRHKVFDEKRV